MTEMIDLDVLITAGIGIISTFIGSWTSWLFARKKYNSEVDNNLIQNMKESLDFYKQLSDDNKNRLEEILKKNEELEILDKKLEEEVRQLRNQMFNIMGQICTNLACSARTRDITLYGASSEKKI